jgi:hypothetical protein
LALASAKSSFLPISLAVIYQFTFLTDMRTPEEKKVSAKLFARLEHARTKADASGKATRIKVNGKWLKVPPSRGIKPNS